VKRQSVFLLALTCYALSTSGAALAQATSPPAGATPAPAAASPPPAAAAADLEPAVKTSSAAARPAAARPASTRPRANAADRIDLDSSQITGNRELPKVLYIVPWKRPELGDLVGRPLNSLLDEVLAPVDRDVFRRENRYFDALQTGASNPPPAAPAGSNAPPRTAAPEPKAKPEN
jgi:hypothetical protein